MWNNSGDQQEDGNERDVKKMQETASVTVTLEIWKERGKLNYQRVIYNISSSK